MEFLNIKQKIVLGIVCIVIVIIISIYMIQKNDNRFSYIELEQAESIEEIEQGKNKEGTEKELDMDDSTIVLHIAGEVNEEGVIEIPSGARVIDAINEAGGLTEDADITNINLAYELKDGEKIYIPKEGEESAYIIEGNNRK